MAKRGLREHDDADEPTTAIRENVSGARIKNAASFPPDTPRIRVVEPAAVVPRSNPTSEEFALASTSATPAAVPIASSGMAGPYHLALEIASGGMATVYLAVHGLEGFQNTVAVKRIHPHLAKDKQFVDMFVDEAHIAARINHPYVCRVFDFGKAADGSYYIAMEFLRGEPLSRVFKALTPERIADPRYPNVIARLIANLAEGLHAAHTLKDTHGECLEVVHRDITPQNLFVLCDGTVRVTDFGIARARVRSHHTEGGRIKGKLSYMSPEQLNQQPVDSRSDLWSLGVVTWELLTGRRLFRAGSEGETVLSVLSRPIPPPSRFAGGVPRQLDAIVLRLLSRDPEQRYSSARELVRALETFLASAGDTVPTMDVADWVEEIFPGVGKRADGLVELAHAVMPPERRQSLRASAAPLSNGTPNEVSRSALDRARVTTPLHAPPAAAPSRSGLRWRRAFLPAAALLAGAFAVFLGVREFGRVAPPPPTKVVQVEDAPSKALPPVSVPATAAAPLPEAPKQPETPAPTERAPSNTKAVARHVASAAPATTSQPTAGSERTGSVQLMTKNGHAEVYVGSRLMGTTPLTLDLPVGHVALTLKPVGGGESRNVTVAIQPGAMSFITVPLAAPVPTASPTATATAVPAAAAAATATAVEN
ncbi:MAG TPA: protein kinase [Polyangiaceae bacterium]|nr:protein kinase [Polyangiaceae bacterium]